ncbi:MAG: Spy/CpxP family protein refolding chaperone [Nevskiales bacterium]
MLAAALTLPVAAWAQTTGSSTTAPAMSTQQRVEARIADLYATLHITTAQEAQWNAFAQVMLDNAQAMQDAMTKNNSADLATRTAEQSLQDYAEIAKLHAQNVEKLSAAFHTLYQTLTPEQKKAADESFRARAEERGQKKAG